MSAISDLYETTVGKKALMAVTGVVLFAFVVVHLLGNLLIFQGPEKLNGYAVLLRRSGSLLWGARAVLLFSVGVHILAAVQLTVRNWRARPHGYARRRYLEADYAARTMVWSGPIVAAFIGYHVLHLTFGTAHPSFDPADVYGNVVTAFRAWPVALVYIVANALLAFHLYHGLWSMFQSLGLNHPVYNGWRRGAAAGLAVAVGAGNISIPVAVLAGVVG
jgi:succinate dehydrogenase / fumarate reductase cytochrome b subunit